VIVGPDPEAARLRALLSGDPESPGVALAVLRGGRVVHRICTGRASLAHPLPITPDTRFHLISVSKGFMAAATLALAAAGRLTLDDPVRRHVPELPAAIDARGTVTLRHLLTMTSGLVDTLEIERLRGVWDSGPARVGDLLDLVCAAGWTSAPPGTRFLYTNVNFVLLDLIHARASGMDGDAWRARAVYAPLGLTRTRARAHEGIALEAMAEPHVPDGDGWVRALHPLGMAGDPLVSSLDDLVRWIGALREGRVGDVDLTPMRGPARLADGRALHYGLGLSRRRYRGLDAFTHTGTQPGWKAHIAWFPAPDLALVLLANREDVAPSALVPNLVDILLDGALPAAHPAARAVTTADPGIDGTYLAEGDDELVGVRAEGGVLRVDTLQDGFRLYRRDDGSWRDGDDYQAVIPATLAFRAEGDGMVATGDLGGAATRLVRVVPPALDAAARAAYAGRYANDDLDIRHTVADTPGGLTIAYGHRFDRARVFPLEPVAPDVFLARATAPGIAFRHLVRFRRDGVGPVVGTSVTMGRVKGIRLRRVA